jgi:hypothetical protein
MPCCSIDADAICAAAIMLGVLKIEAGFAWKNNWAGSRLAAHPQHVFTTWLENGNVV